MILMLMQLVVIIYKAILMVGTVSRNILIKKKMIFLFFNLNVTFMYKSLEFKRICCRTLMFKI